MYSADVLIQDIDAKGWANLMSLADRATLYRILGETRKPMPPRKRLVIVYQGTNVLKAWHSEKGSLLPDFQWSGPGDLEAVAVQEGVDRVTAISRGAIPRIYEHFQRRTHLKDDYVRQLLTIFDAVRGEMGKNLNFYPKPTLPWLTYEVLNQAMRILLPNNSTIVFYLFEGNEVWTSLILGVRDHDIDLVTSHDALVAKGFVVGDWRADYKRILSEIGKLFREPAIGIFGDLVSMARILRSKKPLNALGATRSAGDIIMDPLPMRIRTLLGAGKLLGR